MTLRTSSRRACRPLLAMLAGAVLLLAACGGSAPAVGGANAETQEASAGKALFSTKGCLACHVAPGVPGATGTIGPSLAGIGDSARKPALADGGANTPENIKAWIQDPQKLKPGTMMPNLGLTDKEASDLTAFLLTLK